MTGEPCPRCQSHGDCIVTDGNYTTKYCMDCQTPAEACEIKQKQADIKKRYAEEYA